MKRTVATQGALPLVVALALPATLAAQGLVFQVGGGVTAPTGEFGGGYGAGIHGHVALGLGVPGLPLTLRADGDAHSLPEEFIDGRTTLLSAALNGVFDLLDVASLGSGARLYGVIGGGYYSLDSSLGGAEADPGVQGGLGLTMTVGGLAGALEARVARVFGSPKHYSYLPLTAGIRF
jgi:hypothetical protein